MTNERGVSSHMAVEKTRLIESMETTQDSLGLVDIRATVAALQKVSSGREWKKWSDIHHIYWPERCYPKKTLYREFRELPINKVSLPRDFHDFLHVASAPPYIPDEDLMNYQVISHNSAKTMFESAQIIIRRQREIDRLLGKRPGKDSLKGGVKSRKKAISISRREFDYARNIYSSVPVEARAVEINLNAGLGGVARQLGRFATKPILSFNELQPA
jgi:hypothetical protein